MHCNGSERKYKSHKSKVTSEVILPSRSKTCEVWNEKSEHWGLQELNTKMDFYFANIYHSIKDYFPGDYSL